MKKTIFLALIFAAVTSAHAAGNSQIIKYDLKIEFDKTTQKIKTSLQNLSKTDIAIRRDAVPSSLYIRGVKISAFEDSENLKRIPVYYPMGSNSEFLTVPAESTLTGYLDLTSFMKSHCEVLEKNSILIFWNYSSQAGEFGEYLLLPTDGVFRIKKSDIPCS
ncbi:MAG: hypothetical protein QE485_01905 [Acidovorax sp.]|uniref:hypothetical protein n=1 Tax=Acidovorax sp. TaxID=1872122 RepID=UPI0026323054|nr:hypothetical protein [Acidovorax sp.]MDH4415956.1 hypothetical protein [Acidovorax sp.]